MSHGPELVAQSDRIWKLHKQGVANHIIVQRVGVTSSRVAMVIKRRKEIEKAMEAVSE